MSENIKFNPQQQEAVDFKDGAAGVIASAGSGKTSLLLGRVDKLIDEHRISEKELLCVTFTRNSADDLIKRLSKMGHQFVNVGTFHSICGQILREEGVDINPSKMVQEWQIDNCFKAIDKKADTKEIVNFISFQKNNMRGVDDNFVKKDNSYSDEELREFYREYEKMKSKQKTFDFDDYLLLCLNAVRNNPGKHIYEYILVDEHQDSNKLQNELLKYWCESGNLFVVGDYRQNLYSFRSSDNDFIMNMERYWKGAKTLNVYTNYRSPKNIVEYANHFIGKYYKDYEHHVDAIAHDQEDGHIQVNSRINREVEAIEVVDEIENLINNGAELNDISVLYRNNAHAGYVENELKRREIEYDIANNSSFFKRREVAGILSFLRLIQDTEDNNAFEGVFRMRVHPLMYFSNAIFNQIQSYADVNNTSYFDAMQEISYPKAWYMINVRKFVNMIHSLQDDIDKGDDNVISLINSVVKWFKIKEMVKEKYSHKPEREERLNSIEVLKSFVKGNDLEQFITYVYSNTEKKKVKENAVRLMTIHRSKGLEFDNVFLIGVEDGEFPSEREGAMSDIIEEARLFYVATTRSKKNLWIGEIGKNNRFIQEYGYDE